jgi:cytochrome c peroxidase
VKFVTRPDGGRPARGSCSAVLTAAFFCFFCQAEPPNAGAPSDHAKAEDVGEPILPLPRDLGTDARVAALGEALFQSTIVSIDGKVACSSCHLAERGMADAQSHSHLPGRPVTATNSTTMFNLGLLYKVTWSARFDSLEDHLDWLVANPKIMGTSWASLSGRLSADPKWVERFRAVFPDGVTLANARAALLEYERSLITPDAPFDRFLRGDAQAISPDARRGYGLFKAYGCVTCHQGMLVGGNMLERFGVMRDYFADRGRLTEADLGRFNVTKNEDDRHVFRVPSLRNVALTAPYFHDGSAADLPTAVMIMGKYQLGLELDAEDVGLLVAFLESLTGEYRGKPL